MLGFSSSTFVSNGRYCPVTTRGPVRKYSAWRRAIRAPFAPTPKVLQEMLHRYLSLHHWPEGKQILQDFAMVMRGSVEAVIAEDVMLASELADRILGTKLEGLEYGSKTSKLTARDFLHVAVMQRTGSGQIVSADKDFDKFVKEGIERLDPAEIHHWRAQITGGTDQTGFHEKAFFVKADVAATTEDDSPRNRGLRPQVPRPPP